MLGEFSVASKCKVRRAGVTIYEGGEEVCNIKGMKLKAQEGNFIIQIFLKKL